MSSLAPLHRSDTDLFAAGLGAALARAVAPARHAAAGLLVVFAVLLALPLQAQAQTSISQTAEGATWTLTGHTSVEQGSTYTFTLTLASGSKPTNEYAGFHLPNTSDNQDNQDKLGTDPDDCTSPEQFCVSYSGGGHQDGIWDDIQGHDARYIILSGTTPHTLTATFTVATDATLGNTIEFGAIESNGLPRDNGMIITVVAATTASTDASLSALTLSKGTLSPTFSSDVTTYTASVGDSVSRITVTGTADADANALVAYLDVDGNPLTDAGAADGHQVDLDVGDNVIQVQVTAEDTTTTETYTVTVTRAEFACTAPDLSGRARGLDRDHDGGAGRRRRLLRVFDESESDDGTLSDTTIDYRGSNYIISDIRQHYLEDNSTRYYI